MLYKLEVQKRNEAQLQKKFEEENIPMFIRKYFVNIESKAGAKNYWSAIRDLLLWFMDKKIINKKYLSDIIPEDFYEVESEDVTMYLREKETNGISPTTLNIRKNIFSSFWNYLKRSPKCPVNQNIIESVSYKGLSVNNNLIKKFPSESQMKMMEEKILKKKEERVRERNIAIFRVLKGTGIREAELAGLNLSNLFLEETMPYITVVGKGIYREIEARRVYLTNSACEALKKWLDFRSTLDNIIDEDAVFVNKNGTRTTEKNIISIFETYGYGMTPHMMRHWYASMIATKGNVAFAQQQLGHTSVNTTINNYANGSIGMENILNEM